MALPQSSFKESVESHENISCYQVSKQEMSINIKLRHYIQQLYHEQIHCNLSRTRTERLQIITCTWNTNNERCMVMVDGNPAVTTETKSTVLSRVRVWHTWCTHPTTLANLYRTQVKYIGHHGKYMIYRTHVCFIIQCVYQCNVQCLVSDIIMNIQTVSRPLLIRPADGHWHSYELLDIAAVNALMIWCCKVKIHDSARGVSSCKNWVSS